MCCDLCNGSQEPFFNKTMLGLTRQGCPQDCLRTVSTLPWSARSPGLSPIEPIWDHLGRWYVGDMSRQMSEVLLKRENKEGTFVVRNSSSKGMFTLSLFTRM
ncbi:hypothetical protein TNCV_2465651 [Trichonephila clavipes]|uniref:SH2 domain-containing protein n=1 Tax=Trichonephila clavipes TaxID=2585209 RepID=A0A8X6RDN3_TRICX|nr:hypothetical protein TNCV_2465651 [Trichonephila clavipes]